VNAKSAGQCAAKCAELSHCKSFQFQEGSCVMSKKQIRRSSKYGELLACATKNVLIKADMKVSSSPTVFQKRKKKEETIELLELSEKDVLGESYGFETPDESIRRKQAVARMNVAAELTQTKLHAKAAAQQAMQDKAQHSKQSGQNSTDTKTDTKTSQKKMVQDVAAQKITAVKLQQAEKASMTCEQQAKHLKDQLETLKLKGGSDDSSCQAELADYKSKFANKDQEDQEKVKAAVTEAEAKAKQESDETMSKKLSKQKEEIGAEDNAKMKEKVKAATDGEKQVADAKLAKGKKDEAIAKEALKKAMTLSDAEKEEMKQNKKLAQELGKEKTKAIIENKEKKAFRGELAEAKVIDKARIDKQKKKVEQLESKEIQDSADKAEAEEGEGDQAAVTKKLVAAARHMAIGLSLKKKQVDLLKKVIKKHERKHKKTAKQVKKLLKEKKKANVKFMNCQKDKAKKLRNARHRYRSSVDKLKTEIQTHLTQSELAKRALQLCEGKDRGSTARATARVARRENRAVNRAKRKMGEKSAEKNMEKVLKVKLEAKIGSKLKKEFEKKVAKKVGQLTKKKLSPKCKACVKLDEAEQKMLEVDCKTCP